MRNRLLQSIIVALALSSAACARANDARAPSRWIACGVA